MEKDDFEGMELESKSFYQQYPLAMLAIQTLKEITTRVSVLEARINSQEIRLVSMENNLRNIDSALKDLLDKLNDHIDKQNIDINRLLFWVITSLLAILGFGLAFIVQNFIKI
jgi:hypothetical protein